MDCRRLGAEVAVCTCHFPAVIDPAKLSLNHVSFTEVNFSDTRELAPEEFTGKIGALIICFVMSLDRRPHAFEDFVETTSRTTSCARLFEIFVDAMSNLGFDRVNFSVKVDADIPPTHRGFGILSTYPDDWQRYYADRNLIRIDPVWRCASSAFRPFRWRELERSGTLTARQLKLMRQAEEAGLHNGIGIPFKGPKAQIAGVALATSCRRPSGRPGLDLVSAYCHQFYEVYKRFVRQEACSTPIMAVLSDREREVLTLIGRGTSNDQIANCLNISGDTAGFHIKNIFMKLQVTNRVSAVVAGLTLGMIEL